MVKFIYYYNFIFIDILYITTTTTITSFPLYSYRDSQRDRSAKHYGLYIPLSLRPLSSTSSHMHSGSLHAIYVNFSQYLDIVLWKLTEVFLYSFYRSLFLITHSFDVPKKSLCILYYYNILSENILSRH